jgi:hypothetical protein
MKKIVKFYLLGLLLAFNAHAASDDAMPKKVDTVIFDGVQEHCVQVGEIKFGPDAHWKNCHIARARWVSTIDLIDMYQTQYCLGNDEQSCDQRAWVLFANRAYTKDAKALIVRLDLSTTVYKDPLVIAIGDDHLMSMTSFSADGVQSTNYYIWHMDHWMPQDAKSWLPELVTKLPKGTAIRQSVLPDLESMIAKVNLFKTSDKDCCPTGGNAIVELGFEKDNFTIKNVNFSTETQ